jgi:murein DD-endopeptidase MepM/ murein hydrolase activator NlpD
LGTTDTGATVYAVAKGRVVYVGWDGAPNSANLGYIVIVEHTVFGKIYYSVYAHLDANASSQVALGDPVGPTTVIGLVGNSGGGVDNPIHLHFEVRTATNINLDPANNVSPHEYYWAYSAAELRGSRWLDLRPLFGQHAKFYTWEAIP